MLEKQSPDTEFERPASAAIGTAWRRLAGWIAGALLLLALIGLILHFGDIREFVRLLQSARPAWLGIAVLLQAATYLCAALWLYIVLRFAHPRLPLKALLPLGIAKLFTDQVLPSGGVGGTFVVMTGLRRRGVPQSAATAAIIFGFIGFYSAYLVAVLGATGLLYFKHDLTLPALIGIMVFMLVALTLPLSLLWLRRRPETWQPRRLLRIPALGTLISLIRSVPPNLLNNPSLLAMTTLVQLSIFTLDAATLWVMLRAIGQETSFSTAYIGFVMASVAATLGIVPTGLGTFEATGVGFLRLLGIPLEAALAAILMLRGFTTWLPLIPGFLLARRELKAASLPRPTGSTP